MPTSPRHCLECTGLAATCLLANVACNSSEPRELVEVAVIVKVAGAAPGTTTHGMSIDGHDPLLFSAPDTLRLELTPASHSFHFLMISPNCSVSPASPYVVDIAASDTPIEVVFTQTCF